VLALLGLITTKVSDFPPPWTQINRIASSQATLPAGHVTSAAAFIRRTARAGEPVVILDGMSFLSAETAGVTNVSPYSHPAPVATYEQMEEILGALARAHGTRIYLGDAIDDPGHLHPVAAEISSTLAGEHFTRLGRDPASDLTLWRRSG
jgi:hypothetical protein